MMAFKDPLYITLLWGKKIKKTEDMEHGSKSRFLYGSFVVVNNFCIYYSVRFFRTFALDIF